MVKALLEKGLKLHHAGRLSEAKSLYEQVLAEQPRHPDALHLAGLLALQSGDLERAVELMQLAVDVWPATRRFMRALLRPIWLRSASRKHKPPSSARR